MFRIKTVFKPNLRALDLPFLQSLQVTQTNSTNGQGNTLDLCKRSHIFKVTVCLQSRGIVNIGILIVLNISVLSSIFWPYKGGDS